MIEKKYNPHFRWMQQSVCLSAVTSTRNCRQTDRQTAQLALPPVVQRHGPHWIEDCGRCVDMHCHDLEERCSKLHVTYFEYSIFKCSAWLYIYIYIIQIQKLVLTAGFIKGYQFHIYAILFNIKVLTLECSPWRWHCHVETYQSKVTVMSSIL